MTPVVAWECLGCYGGDDGINTGNPDVYSETCKELGVDAKIEDVPLGAPVKFLGRIYVDLRTSAGSIIDFKRMIGKLHLTVSSDSDPKVVARRKALSLSWTDENTPFIGAWAKAVLRLTDKVNKARGISDNTACREDQSWWYRSAIIDNCLDAKFIPAPRDHAIEIIAREFDFGSVPNDTVTPSFILKYEKLFSEAKDFSELFPTNEGKCIFPSPPEEHKLPVVNRGLIIGEPKNIPVNLKTGQIIGQEKRECCHPECKVKISMKQKYCRTHHQEHKCASPLCKNAPNPGFDYCYSCGSKK